MLSRFALVAVLAASATVAQNISEQSFFNLSSVSASIRSSWCISQHSICGTLCQTGTNENTCSNVDLSFSCLCASNNSIPGLEYYLNTIPTNKCYSAFGSCSTAEAGDLTGLTACTTNIKDTCGTIDSTKVNFASSSSSASPSATSSSAASSDTASASSTSTDSSPSSSSTADSAAVMNVGQQYSLGALTAGALAVFAFML